MSAPLLWDNHTYITPEPGTVTIEQLDRHRQAGFNVVFLNLGDANRSFEQVVRMAAFCRRWLKEHTDRFILIENIEDIERARRTGRLAVGFDVEGMVSIGDQLDALSLYYDLGVRWMLMVYNRKNQVGSGVHDTVDSGLTSFGRTVATEMDRVGMIKCLSHTGRRTALDVLASSPKPCIFSHSNVFALQPHARNIDDELIKACAATGGVIGVSGLSIFLGNRADPTLMADHIDYIVQLVGIDHVGLGLDYGYLGDVKLAETATDAWYWPSGHGYDSVVDWIAPEQIGVVRDELQRKGYGDHGLVKVFGANMLRVAATVWRR